MITSLHGEDLCMVLACTSYRKVCDGGAAGFAQCQIKEFMDIYWHKLEIMGYNGM